MKFAEDHNEAHFKITAYDDESIGVNGKPLSEPFILTPINLVENWEPTEFSQLEAKHLDLLYQHDAEVILIGTGMTHVFPNKDVLRRLAQGQVGFEIMDTQAACRTFNIIMAEGRTVVAGLFLK